MSFLRFLFRRLPTLGARGEVLAERHLRSLGFRILDRNLKVGHDEADLIALDPDGRTIVIVEVKSRASERSAPEAAIGSRKQWHLVRLAKALHKRRRYRDAPFRFDAVAVIVPEHGQPIIRHIPGAFDVQA